jgi:uncharacterized protein YfcZ (UPF0381/DUF406 family)
MNKITRDDTEHGVEYVRADEAQAEVELLKATINLLEIEIDVMIDKAEQLVAEPPETDYAWQTIEEYQKYVRLPIDYRFRIGWSMARMTNELLDHLGKIK